MPSGKHVNHVRGAKHYKGKRRRRIDVEMITALSLDRARIRDALRDLLGLYDRVTTSSGGYGWTAADVKRLEEIRKLAGGESQRTI
jgi:hypothetical protein